MQIFIEQEHGLFVTTSDDMKGREENEENQRVTRRRKTGIKIPYLNLGTKWNV